MNEVKNTAKIPAEVCTVQIIFPVDDDDQALAVKKQITEALKDVPGVQTRFTISNMHKASIPYGP